MTRKRYLEWWLGFSLFLNSAQAQNLVLNPSFEDTVSCPSGANQVSKAQFWSNPTQGSPDYFNACSTAGGGIVSVPTNGFGTQAARTGAAYGGIYLYNPVNREYIQATLSSPLTSGHKYLVSFYVSLADYLELSCGSIGIFFSSSSVSSSTTQILPYSPQIQNNLTNSLTDKTNWVLVRDTLYASGGEQYAIIGNYLADSLSDTAYVGPASGWHDSYYYVDDVSVIDVLNLGISNVNVSAVSIFPNPVRTTIEIMADHPIDEVIVFDLLGNEIMHSRITRSKEVDVSSLLPGPYFCRLISPEGCFAAKFIKE